MSERARILQGMGKMPERTTSAERIAHMSEDVRDTAAQVERKLRDAAQKYVVTGWTADDDAEYTIIDRTVLARLRLTR